MGPGAAADRAGARYPGAAPIGASLLLPAVVWVQLAKDNRGRFVPVCEDTRTRRYAVNVATAHGAWGAARPASDSTAAAPGKRGSAAGKNFAG